MVSAKYLAEYIYIYIYILPKAAEYTFQKQQNIHETFFKIDHVLGHKVSFNKFKKTEVISSIFSIHSTIRLKFNYKKKNNHCTKHKHVEAI